MRFARIPPPPCVRCGRHPRTPTSYLCGPCSADPLARAEVDEAYRANSTDPRREVIERFHWAGGWGSHTGRPDD